MTLILVIVGAVLIYFLQNQLYYRNWDKGLNVSVTFSRKCCVKGESVNLVEVIENNKILPLLMVRLKFIIDRSLKFDDTEDNVSVSDQCYKNDVFSLLFYQKITRTLPFTCTNRGYFVLDATDVVSSNLFYNTQYVNHVPIYTELTVYPQLCDLDRLEIPFRKMMGEVLTRRNLYEDPFEFRGIREYMPGDTMSLINWKATARTGDLRVNVHDYTTSQELCILLDLESETQWEADHLKEECISIAAGLCEKFITAGISLKFITNACDVFSGKEIVIEGGMSETHMDNILTNMARIDLKKPMASFSDIVDRLSSERWENTLYVMVSVATSLHLQKSMEKLGHHNQGTTWILPYTFKPLFEITECPSVEIIPWEVTANEK